MAEDTKWDREAQRKHREAQEGGEADPEFPNIERMQELDREAHIRKSMAAGATREEAERHADEELAERDDASQ